MQDCRLVGNSPFFNSLAAFKMLSSTVCRIHNNISFIEFDFFINFGIVCLLALKNLNKEKDHLLFLYFFSLALVDMNIENNKGAQKYGILFKLNMRREIPHLQATMYYFVSCII